MGPNGAGKSTLAMLLWEIPIMRLVKEVSHLKIRISLMKNPMREQRMVSSFLSRIL